MLLLLPLNWAFRPSCFALRKVASAGCLLHCSLARAVAELSPARSVTIVFGLCRVCFFLFFFCPTSSIGWLASYLARAPKLCAVGESRLTLANAKVASPFELFALDCLYGFCLCPCVCRCSCFCTLGYALEGSLFSVKSACRSM